MGLIVYPALLADADITQLKATLPDFGGLTVHAASPADLLLRARETLMEALRGLEKTGDAWPAASTLAEVRAAHPGHVGGVIWIDVEVEDTPIRVTISIGERLLARIDQAAGEFAMTRSGFLAAAARRQMATGRSPLETPADQKIMEEVAAAGRRIQETLGPQSPVGRTLADLDALALDGLRHLADGVADAMRPRRKGRPAPDRRETTEGDFPPASPSREDSVQAE